MVKFMNDDIKKASVALRSDVKKGKGMRKTLKIKDSKGKERTLSKGEYMGLFEQRNVFCKNHGRVPKSVTLAVSANNPLVLQYQPDAHTCCPTSLSMCAGYLFTFRSISECKKALRTNDEGTDPDNLVAHAKDVNLVATPIKRTWKSVKESTDKHRPVIAHIETKPTKKCLDYTTYDGGHFIVIYDAFKKGILKTKYYRIADPTKGIRTCKASIIDKATKGRNIKYYSIKPK